MTSSVAYKKIAAIIVTYNGSRWIAQCLSSLIESDYPVSIYVVDNSSIDNTVSIVTRFSSVKLYKSSTNLGFGKANNKGIALALADGAEYFFLLNQDAWIDKETIRKLFDAAESFRGFGVVSPLHYTGSGDKLDRAFQGYVQNAGDAVGEIKPVDFINAAAWLVSKDCIEKVGGFGYLFDHYGEDRDYVQRMKYFGFNIGFISCCKIYHDREGRTFDFTRSEKLIWYYLTGSIVRVSDVNYSLSSSLLRVMGWNCRELLYLFLKGNIKAIGTLYQVVRGLSKKLQDIKTYRKDITVDKPYRFINKP